jgi:3-methylcrotonyl-CoA carboxylase beta subunit
VKAATGEVVEADALGGADLHTRVSGVADYAANSEEEAILLGREIVAQWRPRETAPIERRAPEDPWYAPEELYGIVPDDPKLQFDMREVIARIVDGSWFHEYQPDYGTTLVCGFAWIWGMKVGILANNGVLLNDSSLKGAHFMELCNQNRTPLLFLQNITGFMVGRDAESRGICKDGAKMIMVQACSEVPKLTVMVNGSFGAGNYGMCGRAFDPRFVFSWPNHQIGVMGAEQAADTLADVKIRQLEREGRAPGPGEIEAIRAPILASYEREISAWYATSQLFDDGMLDPVDTRNALAIALSASLGAPMGEPRYGVLRL